MTRGFLPTLLFALIGRDVLRSWQFPGRSPGGRERERADRGSPRRSRDTQAPAHGRRGGYDRQDARRTCRLPLRSTTTAARPSSQTSSGSSRARWDCCPSACCGSAVTSFVEMNSYDSTGASNYGTAGYLGNGYFITVKHGSWRSDDGRREPQDHLDQDHVRRTRRLPAQGGRHRRCQRRGRSGRLGDSEGEGHDRPAAARRRTRRMRLISPSRSSVWATTIRRGSSCRPDTSVSARRTASLRA